jgi:hypothetical protein
MAGAKRLVSTGVDVSVFAGNDLSSVDLASECGGAPDSNLTIIQDGTIVILRRGKTTKRVKVNQGIGSECIFNMFGVSRALARLFKLTNRARYKLTYNTASKTLTIRRKPVTFANITVRSDPKLAKNRVVIGNGLGLSGALGITLITGDFINLRKGTTLRKLQLRKLSREFDFTDVFRLNPDNLQRLNLINGKTYRAAYNQISGTLRFFN